MTVPGPPAQTTATAVGKQVRHRVRVEERRALDIRGRGRGAVLDDEPRPRRGGGQACDPVDEADERVMVGADGDEDRRPRVGRHQYTGPALTASRDRASRWRSHWTRNRSVTGEHSRPVMRRRVDAVVDLEVHGSDAEQRAEPEEGHRGTGAGGHDHVGALAAERAPREDEVAGEVAEMAGGRRVHPDGALVGEQSDGIRSLEAGPAALVLLPPRRGVA